MAGISKADKKIAIKITKKVLKKRRVRRKIISAIKNLNDEDTEKDLANIFFENDCPAIALRLFPVKICHRYFNRWLESDYTEVYKSVKFSNILLEKLTSMYDERADYYEALLYGSMIKVVSDSHANLIKQMNLHHNQLICDYQDGCSKELDGTNEEIARLEVLKAKLKLRFLKKN